jgi:hypothetical protein
VERAPPQDPESALSKDHPLLEVDLRNLGYKTFEGEKHLLTFVDFTDINRLAVAWLTLDAPAVAKKTGPRTPEPAHLHVFVLDAKTGQKQGSQEWSTPSYPVGFLGVYDGKFLVCTGNVLRLFSASFESIRERHLPNDHDCRSISPNRQLLLLSSYASGTSHQNTLLDVGTFAAVTEWTEKERTYDISSHWLLGGCGKPLKICIRGIDQSWRPFQRVGMDQQFEDFRNKSAFFVNDGTIVVEAWHEMAVATVDGALLFRVILKHRSFGWTLASGGGERFAVIENRQRGITWPGLDMYAFPSNDRVVVYSVPDRRAIYAVKVKGTSPWSPWESHVNQLALSPDGTLLAVVSDEVLKVYRLPGSNIAPALTRHDAPGQP